MQDFSQVVNWIFAQCSNVLNLISEYFILRVALAVPIVGGFMLTVYYLLQRSDFQIPAFDKLKENSFSSYGFGSVKSQARMKRLATVNSSSGFKGVNSVNFGSDGLSVKTVGRDLITKKRRKNAQAAAEQSREQKRLEREKQREFEQNSYKLHETIYFDELGNIVKSQSYHRNTLA